MCGLGTRLDVLKAGRHSFGKYDTTFVLQIENLLALAKETGGSRKCDLNRPWIETQHNALSAFLYESNQVP
jgi:hypothetical protein